MDILEQPSPFPITFHDIDIRSQLAERSCRPRDYEKLLLALESLGQAMAENPRKMLQRLVEVALELCNAETSGLSLLETHDGVDLFRWEALAGVFAQFRNSTMPREASPCGVCINEDKTQLMYLADRVFPALRNEPRFVEALLIPFHSQGKPIGTVWVVSHTEGRMFDREDERIMRVLAQFAASARELWKALDSTSEANHRKDEILAILGHELRNPLTAISMASQTIPYQARDFDAMMRVAELLKRQTQQLSGIVGDLLDVSRIGTGKLRLQKTRVALKTIMGNAVDCLAASIEKRHHHLSITFPDKAIYLHADAVRLTQLIMNLLENAIKYTPDNGRISIAADKCGNEVCIRIRDNGCGIPKDKLRIIFDQFVQLHSMGRVEGGLGLGLALVHTVAELHGGTVEALSEGAGKGCEFIVRLPSDQSMVDETIVGNPRVARA
jgi:signal transduction histidine kinase